MRISDWSSDVCSSDLPVLRDRGAGRGRLKLRSLNLRRCASRGGKDVLRLWCRCSWARVPRCLARAAADAHRDSWPTTGLSKKTAEHTSELPSLMRKSYAVFCLKKKKINNKILIQPT